MELPLTARRALLSNETMALMEVARTSPRPANLSRLQTSLEALRAVEREMGVNPERAGPWKDGVDPDGAWWGGTGARGAGMGLGARLGEGGAPVSAPTYRAPVTGGERITAYVYWSETGFCNAHATAALLSEHCGVTVPAYIGTRVGPCVACEANP